MDNKYFNFIKCSHFIYHDLNKAIFAITEKKMINLVMCFHTRQEVFFQSKFQPGIKFYTFQPGMKFTCKQNFFHPGMIFNLGYM